MSLVRTVAVSFLEKFLFVEIWFLSPGVPDKHPVNTERLQVLHVDEMLQKFRLLITNLHLGGKLGAGVTEEVAEIYSKAGHVSGEGPVSCPAD